MMAIALQTAVLANGVRGRSATLSAGEDSAYVTATLRECLTPMVQSVQSYGRPGRATRCPAPSTAKSVPGELGESAARRALAASGRAGAA